MSTYSFSCLLDSLNVQRLSPCSGNIWSWQLLSNTTTSLLPHSRGVFNSAMKLRLETYFLCTNWAVWQDLGAILLTHFRGWLAAVESHLLPVPGVLGEIWSSSGDACVDPFSLNGCWNVSFLPAVLQYIVDAFREKTPEALVFSSPFFPLPLLPCAIYFHQIKTAQLVRDVQNGHTCFL